MGRANTRGAHVVFLGYAVGVGKTYAMLTEAQRLAHAGADVRLGLLETHGRADTIALAAGLGRIPCRRVEYHGVVWEEFDPEAAMEVHPDWVLVDELAHTNVPGSRYKKRWEAVEALLDADISVMSTVNVQHLESLNDLVFQVTGVRVAETVPDRILDEAGRLVLVDIEPDRLIARMKTGAVFSHDEIGAALTHFFNRGSLSALREQALSVADRHRTSSQGTLVAKQAVAAHRGFSGDGVRRSAGATRHREGGAQ